MHNSHRHRSWYSIVQCSWNNEKKRKALLKEEAKQANPWARKFETSNGGYQWLPSLYTVSKGTSALMQKT